MGKKITGSALGGDQTLSNRHSGYYLILWECASVIDFLLTRLFYNPIGVSNTKLSSQCKWFQLVAVQIIHFYGNAD